MFSTLWIGGAPDAGKTTLARRLALAHTLALYECDRTDAAHHQRLAQDQPAFRDFLDLSLEQRWVETTPQALADRSLHSFSARFPLVLDDLARLARRGRPVLAEGFCLTPDLVAPHLDDPRRAVWLLPGEAFKRRSWERRGKPSWKTQVADLERGARNLFERDGLLAREIARQAAAHGFEVLVIDGVRSEETEARQLEDRFRSFLASD
jgi:hypothetical protein